MDLSRGFIPFYVVMNTIPKTAGCVLLGLMATQQAEAQDKPWSISGTVRGFYDDNYATSPSNPAVGQPGPDESFGTEIRPKFQFNMIREQSEYAFSYLYGMKWYENRSNDMDHYHQVEGSFDHAFSPRFRMSIADNFALAQEPQLLAPLTGVIIAPIRAEGDNYRNIASVTFEAEISRLWSSEFGYIYSVYDFDQSGPGSRSALLDRSEHEFFNNFRWQVKPDTVGILGYKFTMVNQTSSDSLSFIGPYTNPNLRDSRAHYLYVGADHNFTPTFGGSVRFGGQYTEFPNAVAPTDGSIISPYADLSLSYFFDEASYVTLGVKHLRTQTDIAGAATPTLDSGTSVVYAALNYEITARLGLNMVGQYQNSNFNQGFAGNLSESLYLFSTMLTYRINPFLSAEAGYNYDNLDSGVPNRSYQRNRLFLGITASF